jgi:hypothetical protein
MASFSRSIFINCPFDRNFTPIFHALVFAVQYCGFNPRCALEASNSGEFRLAKIQKIISECKFGIHDLSKVELSKHGLPRFNMPLELGLDLGCKRYGRGSQRQKVLLILERSEHRYDLTISDLSGQDLSSHRGSPQGAIRAVRNWLARNGIEALSGESEIYRQYRRFRYQLPKQSRALNLNHNELEFVDLTRLIRDWLQLNA